MKSKLQKTKRWLRIIFVFLVIIFSLPYLLMFVGSYIYSSTNCAADTHSLICDFGTSLIDLERLFGPPPNRLISNGLVLVFIWGSFRVYKISQANNRAPSDPKNWVEPKK